MSEKNLLFFYYNFDSTTLFSFGGETIMGQSKYPEILNDLNDRDLNDRIQVLENGNGRMSRLIMNHLQFEFNLVPTKVMTDDKAAYIEALNASREEESMLPFQSFMLQEHIKNLKAEIEQYERSMDDDVVINVGKNLKNVGKEKLIELSERQQNIISVVKLHPAITIPELAQRMSGKKTVTTRTIERDIAALQAKGILKREGSRKSGKWIVVNI